MSITAMKRALEALDELSEPYDVLKAQDALRQAIKQAETQKPVVWMYQDKSTHEVRFQKHMRGFVDHGATYETPLYTHPPQRTWQGLTDYEIGVCSTEAAINRSEMVGGAVTFARAIEAKLKEKNND